MTEPINRNENNDDLGEFAEDAITESDALEANVEEPNPAEE